MADEKLNVSPEENPQPSLFDAGPEGAPAQDAPTPEPPAPEEKAAGEKGPAKKDKAAKEKTPEPDKPKGRRGRKPKEEKAGPGEPGGTGARRGRPAKADKAATDKPPAQPRDKMSQGKGGKAATVKGKEEAPAAPPPAPEVPPQPRDATRAEKEEIVYLNLSELFPFKDHPFGVRDDAEVAATRLTGGSRFGYKPLLLGQRLKALAFTSFKPLCAFTSVAAPSRGYLNTD